ncbi:MULTISPECIES: nucleoside-diphosphate kinase [unclassified Neorhizobium]|uniref:nucleoside-diphosphate kinase n=1 Tax=unclassified Neorhizobium TaxID=2629175 RepID=UPI001FF60D52|nr:MULTISPECIES: nucleoside-diphosphate kinase [unclassified Neorhizobium]MCJ9669030.1 nucleoside-diphosphate kinase [Neorhizobium sp. SHOUNA12B]MCJ9744984.1 nucleoside-diphosphate kinase [Neorhizobium sp. SHOUNA12A]
MFSGSLDAATVYGPEVIVSGLMPSLDAFIVASTGLEVTRRFLAVHDAASITDFYSLTGSTSGQHFPLVVDLFEARSCCVSIWRGLEALPRLQKVKGATQPCRAEPGTVRAGFWCDNPVANLLHVSDSDNIAREEFRILEARSVTGDIVAGPHKLVRIAERPLNSGLYQFASAISNHAQGGLPLAQMERDRDAARTAAILINYLLDLSESVSGSLERLIYAFLAGDSEFVRSNLSHLGPISAWQRLMIDSAIHSNPLWMEKISTSPAFLSQRGSRNWSAG